MSEQETEMRPTPERPSDFFNDLMFGRPMPRQEEKIETPPKELEHEEQAANHSSNSEIPFTYEQMEHMMRLAESLGPTLQKLIPYFKMVQSFFTANKGK
ncbi:hypothetical protein [Halalkalibacterium ligniniphilum]|uniref:hypothetical protein n=1 Tax=Halalkalibacterium ligniniphilum TaxID=1134413 RepID=UPI0003456B9E|nr:hypothetical protein [Halalkalibacterium ligniniphilum]